MDPRFLFYITDKIEDATEKFNQYMINRIAKRIVALFDREGNVDIIPSTKSDIRKMQETGEILQDIQKAVKDRLPEIEKELDDAFERTANDVSYDNDRFTEQVVKAESVPVSVPEPDSARKPISRLNITKKEKSLLKRAYDKTDGEIFNLTGTTAETWQKEFIRVTAEAYWKATHGVSINTAISEAIDEAAKYGTTVKYPSGHEDKIEVAVARAVRTGVNQAAGDMTIARCAALGVPQVLVSSHLGARYTEKDEPANHMSWQGKVYDLDWDNPIFSKYKPALTDMKDVNIYRKIRAHIAKLKKKNRSAGDFIEKTGYGTGEGLCGWNCRHTFHPFWVGININNTVQYDSEENKKQYDLEQKQRGMERKLREVRKVLNARKAGMQAATNAALKSGLKEKYQETKNQYSSMMGQYLDFCEKNKLRPLYERLKVPEVN